MKLSPNELKAINSLVHYLSEKFDGHGLQAHVTISTLDGPFEGDKGEIVVTERETSATGEPLLGYGWVDAP